MTCSEIDEFWGGNAFEANRKTSKKSKVVTENKPGLDKPTTTTIDNLGRKQEKDRRNAIYCDVTAHRRDAIYCEMAAQPASEQNEPAPRGLHDAN